MTYSPYLESIQYNELMQHRAECVRLYGSILQVPRAAGPYEECRRLYKGGRVLDVGAGVDQPLKRYLKLGDDLYFSMDNDPGAQFSFKSPAEVPPDFKFGLIVMNQVLEHLTINDGVESLRGLFPLLEPGGSLLISIPNALHPNRYHSNVTHLTNWPYVDLYGLLNVLGYRVTGVLRSNKWKQPRNPLRRWVLNIVCEELRVDWCDTIIVEAQRP